MDLGGIQDPVGMRCQIYPKPSTTTSCQATVPRLARGPSHPPPPSCPGRFWMDESPRSGGRGWYAQIHSARGSSHGCYFDLQLENGGQDPEGGFIHQQSTHGQAAGKIHWHSPATPIQYT